jgi:hypothetical protein
MEATIYFAALVISLIASIYLFRIYKLAKDSYEWPKTKGKIKSVKTSSHSATDDSQTSWFCKVAYSYQVGEKEYSGTRVNFAHVFSNSDYSLHEIIKLEEKFKVQAEVDVFFKENNPSVSVLEPGYNKKLKYALAASVTFNLIFLIGLLSAL